MIVDTSSNVSAHISFLKKRKVTHVGRYYSSAAWKRLTKNEAQKVCASDMRLFTVFENDGDPTLTKDTGVSHAQIALAQAKGIGQPTGSAIYFALEHLPDGYTKKHLSGIRAYMSGVKSVLGGSYKIGAYSDGVVLAALLDGALCDYAWLSASTSFEGSKEFYASRRWALAQHEVDQDWEGMSIDLDEGNGDFGSFDVPTPHREGILTALTSDDSSSPDVSLLRSALDDAVESAVRGERGGGDAACIPALVEIGSSVKKCDAIREQARQAMVQIYGKPTLHNACACTLSLFLKEAGIAVPLTFGAGKLAHLLEKDRHWKRSPVGQQQAGDVAVCRDDDTSIPGADHIFFVVKRVDDDLMSIADNQESHSPHPRYASGKGHKTPVDYFLRAPSAEDARFAMKLAELLEDDVVTADEDTDDLVAKFDAEGRALG